MKKYLPRPWQKVLCWLGKGNGWTVGYRDGRRGRGNTTWHYENRMLGSTYDIEPEFWLKLPARPFTPPVGRCEMQIWCPVKDASVAFPKGARLFERMASKIQTRKGKP
jgi:hypothetical protein